jgi:hypothetical protein
MYRDDGLVVFNSKKTKTQIQTWLNEFQLTVDELCGNSFLQFTAVMCHSGGRSSRSKTNLSVDINPAFPYLNMEMYWSGRFRVHLKPNQQLLYLNRGSSSTSSCYRAIESGVLGRLANLTPATEANLGRPMHQLYPEHAEALQRAGLSSGRLPTQIYKSQAVGKTFPITSYQLLTLVHIPQLPKWNRRPKQPLWQW